MARLPLAVGRALDGDAGRVEALAAACVLHFASADVVDDAQDDDLPEGADWRLAVSAGLGLTFLAQQAALDAAVPAGRAGIAAAFARAGLSMSVGQRRDLLQRGVPDGTWREADYLDCVRGKSGAAFALYAGAAARGLAAPDELVAALEAFGLALGTGLQLASDVADLLGEAGRDRRNQLQTLPVLRAWERLGEGDRPLLIASWLGEPDAPPLPFLLERSGALASCRARIAALRVEAGMALDEPAVPAALAAELRPLLGLLEDPGPLSAV